MGIFMGALSDPEKGKAMKVPPIPANEMQRLAALREYEILDTPAEEAFDDLTLLASEICGTPVALMSLIDEKRQWFKSKHGTELTESAREIAFCAHAIHEHKIFIVEDTQDDERFKDNPLVVNFPLIRFYAGAPLTTPEGYNIGTLCVIDTQPKKLSERQIQTLNALSRRVVSELERKKAFEKLKKMKMSLDDAQRLTKVGSWDWDIVPNMITWSHNQYELFGRELGSPVNLEVYLSHFSPEEIAVIRLVTTQALEGKGEYRLEHEMKRCDGSRRIFLEAGRVEFNAQGKPVRMYGSTQDITEAKEAERIIADQQAKLLTTSKMSALGEMAGGIAHEINNPLTIISGKASQLRREINRGVVRQERLIADLDKIELTVTRIAKIIRGLLSFARNTDHDPLAPIDLSQILSDTVELCSEKMKQKGIQMRIEDFDAMHILCRAPQISQIVMNLLSNAADAIEECREKWISIHVSSHDGYASIAVTDSGAGIPPEVVEKMMQPFFTTKDVGKGTGLGLSLSKGLAEQHGGSLSYDASSPHTRFVLLVPLFGKEKKAVAA